MSAGVAGAVPPADPSVPFVDPSAEPRRERGTRTRAGNAMGRTRAAVLDGAARAVEKYGSRKTTMSDIAALAGIAKATLYNHFRTKEDIYRAAVDHAVRELGEECVGLATTSLEEALGLAADRLASAPVLRRLAHEEPAVIAEFVVPADGAGWRAAREQVGLVLAAAGRVADAGGVDVVLRWVASFAGAPAPAAVVAAGAATLARGLAAS